MLGEQGWVVDDGRWRGNRVAGADVQAQLHDRAGDGRIHGDPEPAVQVRVADAARRNSVGAELHPVFDWRGQCGDLDDPPKDRILVEVQVADEEVSVDGGAAGVPGGQQHSAFEDESVRVPADLEAAEEVLENVGRVTASPS